LCANSGRLIAIGFHPPVLNNQSVARRPSRSHLSRSLSPLARNLISARFREQPAEARGNTRTIAVFDASPGLRQRPKRPEEQIARQNQNDTDKNSSHERKRRRGTKNKKRTHLNKPRSHSRRRTVTFLIHSKDKVARLADHVIHCVTNEARHKVEAAQQLHGAVTHCEHAQHGVAARVRGAVLQKNHRVLGRSAFLKRKHHSVSPMVML
jgi:hypothetical protein